MNTTSNNNNNANVITIKKYEGAIETKSFITKPNAVVLFKESFKKDPENPANKVVSSTKVLTIEGLKEPKPFFIVRLLLTALVAEKNVQTKFNAEFGTITIDEGTTFAKQVDSGIKAKEIMKQFLSTQAIFRTDNEGKVASFVQVEENGKLSDTVLNLNNKSELVKNAADKKYMKAAINNAANAFLSQINYWSAVGKEVHDILTMCDEKAKAQTAKAATAEKPKKTAKPNDKNAAQIRAELLKGQKEETPDIDPIKAADERLKEVREKAKAAKAEAVEA